MSPLREPRFHWDLTGGIESYLSNLSTHLFDVIHIVAGVNDITTKNKATGRILYKGVKTLLCKIIWYL